MVNGKSSILKNFEVPKSAAESVANSVTRNTRKGRAEGRLLCVHSDRKNPLGNFIESIAASADNESIDLFGMYHRSLGSSPTIEIFRGWLQFGRLAQLSAVESFDRHSREDLRARTDSGIAISMLELGKRTRALDSHEQTSP